VRQQFIGGHTQQVCGAWAEVVELLALLGGHVDQVVHRLDQLAEAPLRLFQIQLRLTRGGDVAHQRDQQARAPVGVAQGKVAGVDRAQAARALPLHVVFDGVALLDGLVHVRTHAIQHLAAHGLFQRATHHPLALEVEFDFGVTVDGHHIEVHRIQHKQADGQVAQQCLQELALLLADVLLCLALGDVVEQADVLAPATAFVEHLDGIDLAPVSGD